MRWSRIGPFVAIGVFVVLGLAKGAHDMSRTWKGESSTKWVEVATEWNPWLALPNPEDIASGREPIRPMREVATFPASSDLTLRWSSEPFDCEMTNHRTVREDGDMFAVRAGSDATSMLRAFPAR